MEVLHHRHMPTSLEDFRFMKHERRKNDVTLRQHDNCCFENNFLQTKYWPAVCCSHLVHQLPRICRASVIPIMGNCLKGSGQDDISLLHDEESTDSPRTGEPPPPYQEEAPIFIQSQHAPHLLSEEQQIRLAQRLGLIQHLPVGKYDGSKGKKRECVICMTDFAMGDPIRFLPCMHIYHKDCIEDWLVRSFTCPSCMEPVEAALLSTYYEASTE